MLSIANWSRSRKTPMLAVDMRKLAFLPLLFLAGPASAADDNRLLGLLPEHARIVLGVKVRQVAESPLARSLTQEFQNSAGDWSSIPSLTGFDPFQDLDEVILASTGAGEDAPVLIVASGRFATARAAADATLYHGVPLAEGDGKSGGSFAFLDDFTAVAGDLAEVKAAIDRRESLSSLDSDVAANVAKYRALYEIWCIAGQPKGLVQRFAGSENSEALQPVDSLRVGIGLTAGLEIAAEVQARSGEDAQKLAGTLALVEAMVKASQPQAGGAKIDIQHQDTSLKIAVSIPEEALKQAIRNQGSVLQRAAAQPVKPSTPAPPRPVVAPAPRPVRPAVRIQSSESNSPSSTSAGETAVFTLPGPKAR
jgi:hypothetical protein